MIVRAFCLLLALCGPALADSMTFFGQPDLSQYATASQLSAVQAAIPTTAQMSSAAPVQAVNTKTGQVTIPTLCRQQSTSTAIPTTNPGTVTWTFPNTSCSFASVPSCWNDISTSTSGWVFDQPLKTAVSTSSVTYTYTAHATVLSISLGSLALSIGPPANSTTILTCTAPPA